MAALEVLAHHETHSLWAYTYHYQFLCRTPCNAPAKSLVRLGKNDVRAGED